MCQGGSGEGLGFVNLRERGGGEGADGEVYVMRNFTSDKSCQFHLLFQESINHQSVYLILFGYMVN